MIGTGELIIIFLAILLLFGGKKLPELAKSLGQAMREFRSASVEQAAPFLPPQHEISRDQPKDDKDEPPQP